MLKWQGDEILIIIETLREAHGEIRKFFSLDDTKTACRILGDCQDGAAAVVNAVSEEALDDAVREYYEALYQTSIADVSERKAHVDHLDKLLDVMKSVVKAIKVKIEIVFFPYKASMWDSLESIYHAAKEDKDCEVFVVAIPYFDKFPGGRLGEMHYEGADYPKDIPITDWQTYHLEKRRPDIAYIHSPFDDTNAITQVHEKFFSGSLKEHVGLLCYSPYWVVGERLPTPYLALVPGVKNSDVVVVQSEQIREDMIQAFREHIYERKIKLPNEKRYFEWIEKKIAALGSPKLDAVMNARRENYELPKDWRQLIENADGSHKKVIFYNTTINAMLSGTIDEEQKVSDQYLKKLESVFEFFRHRKDAVLLWRPHPLLEQTFHSMRPKLHAEYTRIVREYKESGFGIYDDSAQLHRAIAVSDAYYEDGSSVGILWKATGKPMLQNDIGTVSYKKRLALSNLYFDGEYFWCTAVDFNGLFRISHETLKAEYMGQFPNEKKVGNRLFIGITECDGKLYFAPFNAQHIGVYDKNRSEFTTALLKQKEEDSGGKQRFLGAFTYGKFVFLTGYRAHVIVRIDTETNAITRMEHWKKQVMANKDKEHEALILYGCQVGEKLFFPSIYANSMLMFDMSDCSSKVYRFNSENKFYFRGVHNDGKIWLCSYQNSCIGIYDISTGQLEECANDYSVSGFTDFCALNNNIYCFTHSKSKVMKINMRTKSAQQLESGLRCYGDVVKVLGDKIYALSHSTGNMLIMEPETMNVISGELNFDLDKLPDISYETIFREAEKYSTGCLEDAFVNLEALLQAAGKPIAEIHNNGNCGADIHRYLRLKNERNQELQKGRQTSRKRM